MKKLNTRKIRSFKKKDKNAVLRMLTCYDFQTAQMLNETELELILVGDSLANVVLGLDTTVGVGPEEMKIFGAAVKRGAPEKFVIVDMPFGSYNTISEGLKSATDIFRHTRAEAVKLEGAYPYQLELIERLTQVGIPVMGHIGLTPQSVHQQGGYYTHGKTESSADMLKKAAKNLEKAGVFAVVLECVAPLLCEAITEELSIPTIGIGSGEHTDGQVLVINDLLKLGDQPPAFCSPVADLRQIKKELIEKYLADLNA